MPRLESFDVVIVGGGAMGCAAAWRLGERGAKTLLLEQFRLGHDRGSSRGPTRIFRYAYAEETYVRLMLEARRCWDELAAASGEALVRTTGALNVGPWSHESAAAMTAAGIAHEWLDGEAATALLPTVDLVDVDRVLYHADAGVVAAERALRACVRLAAEHGVRVEERVRVERVAPDGDGVVVEAAGRAVSADCAIVSAGAWSPRLLAGTGVALDVTPSSTHVAYYSGRQDGEVPALIEHFVDDPTSYSYVVPSLDGSGVKVGRYWKEQEPVDPDARTLEVDDRVIAVHSEYVARRLPTLDPVPVHSESCLYEMTASEDFVVDRAGPIVVGAGFSGHGFKFMPLVGRLLADAALGTLSEPLPAELSLAAHASTRAGRPAR